MNNSFLFEVSVPSRYPYFFRCPHCSKEAFLVAKFPYSELKAQDIFYPSKNRKLGAGEDLRCDKCGDLITKETLRFERIRRTNNC